MSDRAYFQSTMASHSKELSVAQKALADANKKERAAVEACAQSEMREKQLQVSTRGADKPCTHPFLLINFLMCGSTILPYILRIVM